MDIVITYVNGLDPVWQQDYEQHTNTPILEKRFRDWGTLRYLFRGIEKNMPFIKNVFLVVSHNSQIPEWINRQTVKVVLHSDIIPRDYLPTFNCNPIEMHLHRIEGLGEEFLYFNDDMFPMLPCSETDFFRQGKGVIGMSHHWFSSNMYKRICRNSDRLARKMSGLSPSCRFLRPQHICSPMLKSVCEELYCKAESEILASLTRIRTENDLNQYIYLDYMYLNGHIVNEKMSKKHVSVGFASESSVMKALLQPTRKLICINDVHLSEDRYLRLHETILHSFELVFPQQSKYEK